MNRERLRRSYRPARVQLLFIGESPPASGRFFYQADSGLYRAMRDAFIRSLPGLEGRDFRESFCGLGCYLVDLCGEPVDRLGSRNRKNACLEAEPRLGILIRQLHPAVIVTLVRSIAPNVRRAQQRAKWNGLHLELPYPGRWQCHRVQFEKQLVRFLQDLKLA